MSPGCCCGSVCRWRGLGRRVVGVRVEGRSGLDGDVEKLVAGGRLSMAVTVARLDRLGAIVRQYALHVRGE